MPQTNQATIHTSNLVLMVRGQGKVFSVVYHGSLEELATIRHVDIFLRRRTTGLECPLSPTGIDGGKYDYQFATITTEEGCG
jgi:hypothetical protein